MANFLIVVDQNAKRRSRFLKEIKSQLSTTSGLTTNSCSCKDFYAIWAAGSWAPIDYFVDQGGAAVVWGDAIKNPDSEHIGATELYALWKDIPKTLPKSLDGFHAAASYNPGRVVLGADPLGIFPIYYFETEKILLAGSSPELFQYHPDFNMKFNPEGLVGILLTNGIFKGRTLLTGVKRLEAGHLLIWKRGEDIKEIRQYRIPLSNKYFGLSLSEHVEIIDNTVDKAINRHVPQGEKYGFLLSGGLDSRMMAGYLKRKNLDVVALTEGVPTDFDMKLAKNVASALGFQHHEFSIGLSKHAYYANLTARWEHLASGFNVILGWGFSQNIRGLTPRVISTFLGDSIVGGSHINWARSQTWSQSKTGVHMSFKNFFKNINSWGLRPSILRKLLQPDIFDNLVSKTLEEIKRVYESYSTMEFQRAWCFDLHHRQRFHVGGIVWLLSFGAWPILPIVDSKVIEVMGGMPQRTLENRVAQKELVNRKFPKLAALPLDRSSYDTTPLRPTLKQRLKSYLIGDKWIWRISRHARYIRHFIFQHTQPVDPRYFYRIWNLNSSGWKAVRELAEQNRKLVKSIMNETTLRELLPSPDVTLKFRNEAVESSGLKCLLGFLIWSKEHLPIQNIPD